jgi:hypothetical protein
MFSTSKYKKSNKPQNCEFYVHLSNFHLNKDNKYSFIKKEKLCGRHILKLLKETYLRCIATYNNCGDSKHLFISPANVSKKNPEYV